MTSRIDVIGQNGPSGEHYKRECDACDTPEKCTDLNCIHYRGDMHDQVLHPLHYTGGGVECIEAIEAALTPEEYRGYIKGSVLKYTWRERKKGGDVSLAKAHWYLERLLGLTTATK